MDPAPGESRFRPPAEPSKTAPAVEPPKEEGTTGAPVPTPTPKPKKKRKGFLDQLDEALFGESDDDEDDDLEEDDEESDDDKDEDDE